MKFIEITRKYEGREGVSFQTVLVNVAHIVAIYPKSVALTHGMVIEVTDKESARISQLLREEA